MAFPGIPTVTETAIASPASDTVDIDLPASVSSGDLLVMAIRWFTSTSATTPSGWTAISSGAAAAANGYLGIYAKVAAGTEGGGTVSITTNFTPGAVTAHSFAIPASEWHGSISDIEGASVATNAGTTTPDPPSITASWGSDDNLFCTITGQHDDDVAITAAPTNYGTLVSTISGGGTNSGCSIGTAFRQYASASDDPGTFTLASTESTIATTIVIRPAAGGSTYTLTAGQGSVAITGQAAALKADRKLTAAQGSVAISGQAASLKADRILVAAQGSVVITGQDATLTYGAVGSTYTLTASVGSVVISGQAAALKADRILTAAQGAVSITGQDVALRSARKLAAGQGSIAITGQGASLKADRKLTASLGSIAITGYPATLSYSGSPWVVQSPDSTTWSVQAADTSTWTEQ